MNDDYAWVIGIGPASDGVYIRRNDRGDSSLANAREFATPDAAKIAAFELGYGDYNHAVTYSKARILRVRRVRPPRRWEETGAYVPGTAYVNPGSCSSLPLAAVRELPPSASYRLELAPE